MESCGRVNEFCLWKCSDVLVARRSGEVVMEEKSSGLEGVFESRTSVFKPEA